MTTPTITTPGAPEPSGDGPPPETFASRVSLGRRAGAVAIPFLTLLLAFFVGGLVVLVVSGKNPLSTYRAIFDGTGLNWFLPWETCSYPCARREQSPADTHPVHGARPHGTRRRVRIPLRAVQHRRAGAVHRRHGHRGVDRHLSRLASGVPACDGRGRRCSDRRWIVGGHRRSPEGNGRGARGHHDDHAQLDRHLGRELPRRHRRADAGRQPQDPWVCPSRWTPGQSSRSSGALRASRPCMRDSSSLWGR